MAKHKRVERWRCSERLFLPEQKANGSTTRRSHARANLSAKLRGAMLSEASVSEEVERMDDARMRRLSGVAGERSEVVHE